LNDDFISAFKLFLTITIEDAVVIALPVQERKRGKKEAGEVWIFYLLRYNICMNGLLLAMTVLFCFAKRICNSGPFDLI